LQLQFLIHLFPVSSGFHFYTHAFRSLLRVFYALPKVHDTSSKNVKLSSATTSFTWRHTNTSKNHGYNAVADDSCRTRKCRLLQRTFPWRHTNSSKNHGYNTVADDLRLEPFRAEDSALASYEEGQKGQTFSDHTYPTVSSRPKGEMCAKFGSDRLRNVNFHKVQTNIQLYI